jgi:hypothetical protein
MYSGASRSAVAQPLYQGTQPDAIYTLDEADLIGGFLRFLRQTAILADWQVLTVVINLWRNGPPSPDGPRVYLTNGPVADPWRAVDGYDDRSWIENGLFGNSKPRRASPKSICASPGRRSNARCVQLF